MFFGLKAEWVPEMFRGRLKDFADFIVQANCGLRDRETCRAKSLYGVLGADVIDTPVSFFLVFLGFFEKTLLVGEHLSCVGAGIDYRVGNLFRGHITSNELSFHTINHFLYFVKLKAQPMWSGLYSV